MEGVDRPNMTQALHSVIRDVIVALTRISPSDFALLYEMMEGSLHIAKMTLFYLQIEL